MNAESDNTPLTASFQKGVYESEGTSRPVESLDGIRESLAAGRK
jgi:hypothetical protein